MTDVPARCPTCDTAVPSGRTRCVGCGRVFGEDNRCPSCNAVAAVRKQEGVLVCAACSAPRERLPGTVVLSGSGLAVPTTTSVRRGASVGLRGFGVLSIGLGVLAAAAAAVLVPGAAGIILALLAGSTGVGVGAMSLRAGARQSARVDRDVRAERERVLMDLAEKSEGDLTVTEVARALGMPMAEADELLTSIADGSRVTVEVDPEGIVHFVFREIRLGGPTGPRVRVEDARFERLERMLEEQGESVGVEEPAGSVERSEGK